MSIVVFYLNERDEAQAVHCGDSLTLALQTCDRLRAEAYDHVTISSAMPNSVGKPGVDSVQNGTLPSGEPYGWRKRR
jgi:hypothetical protein